MAASELIFFIAIQLCAGIIVGITSFGGNLFAIPLMTLIMSPREAILIGCLSGVPLVFLMTFIYRRSIIWKDVLLLSVGSLIGSPLGSWLLAWLNVRFLLFAAALCISLFLLWQLIAARVSQKDVFISRLGAAPCGFLSGLMMATTSMGGPPIAFYAYLRHWSQPETLGSLSFTWGLQLVMIVYFQWSEGLYSPDVAMLSLYAAIAVMAGIVAAMPVVKRMDVALFRKLVLLLLGLSAASLVIKAILI